MCLSPYSPKKQTMKTARSTAGNLRRRARRGGFSLVETMIVLTVIGIIIAISAPSYNRAVEQMRADVAAGNLRGIWSAERVYWLENHVYATDLSQLTALGLLDPEILQTSAGYCYSFSGATDGSSFAATATRVGTPTSFAIDGNGSITVLGGSIDPGFQ
jgi:prepilin-type N-terminal cleavage/methylation domain-containing protein